MGAKRRARNLKRWAIGLGVVVLVGGGMTAWEMRGNAAVARLAAQCEAVRATEENAADGRAAASRGKLSFAVLGDSYAQGMYLDNPLQSFPYRLQARTGGGVLVSGSGGSGYTSAGPCGNGQVVNRLGEVLASAPPVLIVEAGLNDVGHDDERIAVADVIARVAAESPKTKLVLVGPFAPPSQAGDNLTAVRDTIRGEAAVKHVLFVDPSTWTFELLPDGLHPTVKGHEQIAARLFAEIGPLLR